ncbi:probable E3 ubiquitin-protein ligase RHY1A [Tanacetum coccineum]|uniref:Probable E3 ubiquitin-protein ligase RHY1A n=1 Tax=Tanacetum coccineum TaxID=301880 RepID=A0ABQ5IZA1_9ASTR
MEILSPRHACRGCNSMFCDTQEPEVVQVEQGVVSQPFSGSINHSEDLEAYADGVQMEIGIGFLELQSSSSASSIHPDDFSYSSFIESSNNLLKNLSRNRGNLKMRKPSSASRECSICLEGFENGDELINLPCMHRFHSCCLLPWVEEPAICGLVESGIASMAVNTASLIFEDRSATVAGLLLGWVSLV